MTKLYYFNNQYPLCGVCCNVMYPDIIFNSRPVTLDQPNEIKFYCTTKQCSQFEKRITIKPTEVEGD